MAKQSGMRPLALVVFETDRPEILENAKEIRTLSGELREKEFHQSASGVVKEEVIRRDERS
jgi:hypothetical protein